MPLLALEAVHAGYGAIRAVRGISIEVDEGETVCLIGSNGAGKSTTLRAISGLVRVTDGGVLFRGRPITNEAPHRVAAAGIAHVPEGRGIFARLTVTENLEMGAYLRPRGPEIARDLERAFETFPRLRERAHQTGGTLSGGEQQMLAIGRALMARPVLLLLDEPSMGLSPILTQAIFERIREINREGTTILLVEQNATSALAISNRGYVVESGQIVLSGTGPELSANDSVRRAYLGEL
ncbi:MAG: ABC transporter ATP-binding protein [Chloroflexi bacterium]|nr:ABC transporter ATP-binding protein [Chloroflexota bacterium]MDA1001747.1 ABC transporter ATP-binding protein [Chloroflexota bacterium]